MYGATVPFVLFAGFQLMFAAITPALISGAFAERKRFRSFVIFTVLWSLLVYSPIALRPRRRVHSHRQGTARNGRSRNAL